MRLFVSQDIFNILNNSRWNNALTKLRRTLTSRNRKIEDSHQSIISLKQIKRFSVTTNLLRQTNFNRKVCSSPVLESPPRPAQGENCEFDYNSPTRKGSLKRRTHNETPRHFHIYQAKIEKRK